MMTTKWKIIIGFLAMLVLLLSVSALSYRDLQSTSNGFKEYERLSAFNTNASDLTTYLQSVESRMYQFLDSKDPAVMKEAAGMVDEALKRITVADGRVHLPARKAVLEDLRKRSGFLRTQLGAVASTTTSAYDEYQKTVQPAAREMGDKLLLIATQARGVSNAEVAYSAAKALFELGQLRSTLSRYYGSRTEQDAERGAGFIRSLDAALQDISAYTDAGRKAVADARASFETLSKSFSRMHENYTSVNKALNELSGLIAGMTKDSTTLSAGVDKEATENGMKMLAGTAAAQNNLLFFSGGGLLLGIAVTLFILISLIKVLNSVSRFAGSIAKGDFKADVSVHEKGEIGVLIAAMKRIPETLDQVIAQARELANAIASGWMGNRLKADTLPGTFADVATSINAVSNAYCGLLDSLSQPIVAADKSRKIMYLNAAAQQALGGNRIGENCGQLFKSAVCGTEKCFSECALKQNTSYQNETTVVLGGQTSNISVTAIPLYDMNKTPTGCVEVITDLTEIRTQQANVMRAVAQASEISDRVAAASEELAAQVEQISHGSEVQRSRVESTASAMTEMNSTVLEVARSAGMASEQSEGTRKKAADGATLVNKVVSAINQVNTVANTLQDNMQELGKQAEGIGGVMNVISDIADQTNLLALNAAIEAARAGEAGRGFAVVADEVRKLAEKTMTATQEVGSNIRSIQQSASTNIQEVGTAVRSISEATNLANSSGTALKEIVDLASANSSIVASIATAAEEQSSTSEEINRSIDEINRIVSETSQGMVQSSSAVQDLSRMAQDLRRVMETLSKA